MSDSVSKLPKPQLRGLLHGQIKVNLILSIAFCIGSAVALKFMVNEPRKARYAEFYKNYDIDKAFNEMRKKGVFTSCKAD